MSHATDGLTWVLEQPTCGHGGRLVPLNRGPGRRLPRPLAGPGHVFTAPHKTSSTRASPVTSMNSGKIPVPAVLAALLVGVLAGACGPPEDPEVAAVEYLRAVNSRQPDAAVDLLDIEEIARRVEEQIVIVQENASPSFLENSIETLLWGLFQETTPADFTYVSAHAEVEDDTARVTVRRMDPEGKESETVVHLRRTGGGWLVSGDTLDPLVTYVVQRLQERYQ